MLVKLVKKNIYTGYKKWLYGITANAFLAGWFVQKFYGWEVFMMLGYLTISSQAAMIYFIEKTSTNETLTASLPTTRYFIVLSRYITSMIIAIIGFIIWYSAALFWSPILNLNVVENIVTIKVGIMASIFMIVSQSIFLPASFKLGKIGMGLSLAAGLIISIIIIANGFAPYRSDFNPSLTINDFPLLFTLLIFILILLPLSYYLSQIWYERNDL
ncbi:MAG: ABC-2 transporter permease [Candidatus Cloacimonetes bacterium]|nr:ABC-2 transporter permease [Candidatus Cloacimonadota bacterium]